MANSKNFQSESFDETFVKVSVGSNPTSRMKYSCK